MSDDLPSPLTVASMEDHGWEWAGKVPDLSPPPLNYTLGNLLSELRQFAETYQRGADDIRQHDSIIQQHDWIRLGAFVGHARANLLRIPGFNDLRTFAIATWGEEITLPVCRRILGALVQRSKGTLSVADAEKMTLAEAASRLTPAHDGNESTPSAVELTAVERAITVYLRDPNLPVTAVAQQAGCDRSLLYRDERFKRLRQAHRGTPRKGKKSKEGDVEAEDDAESDDER